MSFQQYTGELAALLVALFWTITALSFELATKRIGSLSVNITRLLFGFIFLSFFTLIKRGLFLPVDAGTQQWVFLLLSGLVGFVFGDYFLFASYKLISSRIAMLIMTFVPPITAIMGWIFLGERMSLQHLAGMSLTVSGISITVFNQNINGRMQLRYPAKGIFYAFLGVLGQAGGLILSKIGMKDYDPFASTQIRIFAGFFGFLAIVIAKGYIHQVWQSLKDRKALTGIALGSFFGPFLGVSFSLVAIKYTSTGIASTLMSIVPILIIPPSAILMKQKIGPADYLGALISVAGVVLFFV